MSADPGHSEVLKAIIPDSAPKTGQTYRHFKGGQYSIVGTGLLESNLEPVVIYMNAERLIWVRTLENFAATVKTDAGKVPRFVLEA